MESLSHHVDDEVTRKRHLAELLLFANQSFQSIDMTTRELDVLSQTRAAPSESVEQRADPRQERQNRGIDYSERLDKPPGNDSRSGPLLTSNGKPLQPFTLTDKRSQFGRGVFRPDHSLPTMSIDEYLEEERRRGGMIEGGGVASTQPQEPDEDNIVLADAETMKARAWDDFIEANPKGSGNTINRG